MSEEKPKQESKEQQPTTEALQRCIAENNLSENDVINRIEFINKLFNIHNDLQEDCIITILVKAEEDSKGKITQHLGIKSAVALPFAQ